MRRSEINRKIGAAEKFFARHRFALPPWAHWSPAEWRRRGPECDEIRRAGLGWDITDFGLGDFARHGLLLFTVRNGRHGDPAAGKPYAEKIMVAQPGQETPLHFHWKKMEDIINRGGGDLVMQLWKADAHEGLSRKPLTVQVDGVTRTLRAGGKLRLKPGESITLEPFVYHRFWAEAGPCLIGEVSMVNDDANDNRFHDRVGRFPEIAEDEPAQRLLCNEYPAPATRRPRRRTA